MAKINDKQITFNNLSESINRLKDNLQPVLFNVKKNEMNRNYTNVLKNFQLNQNSQKMKSLCLKKKGKNAKTILEYSFIEDQSSMKSSNGEKENNRKLSQGKLKSIIQYFNP
jgi:hypothetical protein